ncbi:hypothetical protein FOIG_06164 [Fusarium odoratissimum NRRL 54006]|uniref:Uncharacterized protein n=2 Tax=Fusarium oxysporum species complex TaxID=171631 RepID=X0K3P8_FUSO5|nr:uncharacterized protein FOIG_06164 [Fusarium odoratissimum NRRL 54006]EXM03317.1 hypothetical protein FOIG_06164 [Fusarium odoratissimum NRRL 54006]TXC11356.1 hypothetical protein FocTR4_00007404 [Fusarium oxysporum f. sp. cubense]
MAVKSDHVYVINLFKSGLSRKAKCSKENTPMGDSIRGIAIAIAWSVADQKTRGARRGEMRRVTERQFKVMTGMQDTAGSSER